MISFKQVSKRYGTQDVLDKVSFHISDNERAGIVGPNGAGKSTVFALLCDEISTDAGQIEMSKSSRIGHLRQQFNTHEVTSTILEYAECGRPDLQELHSEIETLEKNLHLEPEENRERILAKIGELQTEFEHSGGYEAQNKAEAALFGLGFTEEDLRRQFRSFSGGWQMRAELARVLVADPAILLLDEPTNYLDIPAIEWMQKFLRAFRGTMLLISHDRYLLNTLTTVTIEIANGDAVRYEGNYDYYVRERQTRTEHLAGRLKNQGRERERAQRFIDRFRAQATKAALVQSKIKKLEKMEEIVEQRAVVSVGKIRLRAPERSGQEVVRLEDAGLTYDGNRWVLRNLDVSIQRGDRIALVGLNGLGKTTLLRMLAGHIPISEGKRVLGHKVTVGYQSQEFAATMDPRSTAFEIVKNAGHGVTELEVRTILGGFGFSGEAADKFVSVLSGGEKVRLAFARLLVDPPNFLVLDEPTTHLDIGARESLENALAAFDGTICVVSHDIVFVKKVATKIIVMKPPGVELYYGGYDYYCEKTAESAARNIKAAAEVRAVPSDRKLERRRRAEAVQELSRRKSHLKTHVKQAEKRIQDLEKEQVDLTAVLQSGDVKIDYAATNRRLSDIRDQLEQTTRIWEQSATELERLNLPQQAPAEE